MTQIAGMPEGEETTYGIDDMAMMADSGTTVDEIVAAALLLGDKAGEKATESGGEARAETGDGLWMGWTDAPAQAGEEVAEPEPDAKSEQMSIAELLNIVTCADCKEDILDDDHKTCSCGMTD